MTPEEYLIVGSAGVTSATLVILFVFLSRYRLLVSDAAKSTRLAKDLWDAMNSRLSAMDTRIVDVMAKVEIQSTKHVMRGGVNSSDVTSHLEQVKSPVQLESEATSHVVEETGSRETEIEILRCLLEGPKTSKEIRVRIGKSREHTARLLKGLFDGNLVVRNDRTKPYVYELTDSGKNHLGS